MSRFAGQALGLLGFSMALVGCAPTATQQTRMVDSRQVVPVSVCRQKLAPQGGASKGRVRDLDPEQWLGVIVPTFDREKGFDATTVDCTGNYLFANESLRGGASTRGWPRLVDPEDVAVMSGPNGMRTVWIRSLKFENGDEGGPIALARAYDDAAEIYAVGTFRGPPNSTFLPVRLGNDSIVVAETKECPEDGTECRKRAYFFLPRRGRLIEGAVVDMERTTVVPSTTQRGLFTQYRLTTDVTYQPEGILLLEQIQVRITRTDIPDLDSDRRLRTVEFARFLKVERDSLFSSNDPLWERVVGRD